MIIFRAWATCAKTVQIVSSFCFCESNPKGKKQELSINLSVILPNALQVTSDLGGKSHECVTIQMNAFQNTFF